MICLRLYVLIYRRIKKNSLPRLQLSGFCAKKELKNTSAQTAARNITSEQRHYISLWYLQR